MKVQICNRFYSNGGVEVIAQSLHKNFDFHTVCFSKFGLSEGYEKVFSPRREFIFFGQSLPLSVSFFVTYFGLFFRRHTYFLLHMPTLASIFSLFILAVLRFKKVDVFVHARADGVFGKIFNSLFVCIMIFAPSSWRIIFTSQHERRLWSKVFLFKQSCFVVKLFLRQDLQFINRYSDFLLDDDISFLFVGRLVRYKGLESGLSELDFAVSKLNLRYRPKFHIVGNGPLRQSLVEQSGAVTSIRPIFHGSLSDSELKDLLASSRFLFFPSISSSEALGLVQLEAIANHIVVLQRRISSGTQSVFWDFQNVHRFVDKEGLSSLLSDLICINKFDFSSDLDVMARSYSETTFLHNMGRFIA